MKPILVTLTLVLLSLASLAAEKHVPVHVSRQKDECDRKRIPPRIPHVTIDGDILYVYHFGSTVSLTVDDGGVVVYEEISERVTHKHRFDLSVLPCSVDYWISIDIDGIVYCGEITIFEK